MPCLNGSRKPTSTGSALMMAIVASRPKRIGLQSSHRYVGEATRAVVGADPGATPSVFPTL